jgi:hypothetical protein
MRFFMRHMAHLQASAVWSLACFGHIFINQRAHHLRNHIENKVFAAEAPASPSANTDSRVEMSAGNVAKGISTSEYRQAEGSTAPAKPMPSSGKAAAAKD